jgi:hypothetical protein
MKRIGLVAIGLALAVGCSRGGEGQNPAGQAAAQSGTAQPGASAAPMAGGAQAWGSAPSVNVAPSTSPAVSAPPRGSNSGTAPPQGSPAASAPAQATPVPLAPPQVMPAPPAPPPQPQFREVTVPAGMRMTVVLETPVSSDGSKVEDTVRGKLGKPIEIDGKTAVPEGTQVIGSVMEATQSGRVQGRALVSFRFDRLLMGKETYAITTARVTREAESTKGEDAKKIGIGGAAGAVVGAIAGGGKGAAIGAGVGAGAGTGVVMSTRGDEVRLGAGAVLTVRVDVPFTVNVPVP